MKEQTLFALLRLGLGISTDVQKENISELFLATEKQWLELEETARIQGVSGVVLDGLRAVTDELGANCFCHSVAHDFWQKFILQWIGSVMQGYETGNMQQMVVIDAIQRLWVETDIRMMLMKGQAAGTYYPEPKHRCPGDIDCYLFEDYAKGNEVAKEWANKVDESWYKHSVIAYDGQTIENHQYFVHTREGKKSKQLNQVLCDTLKDAKFDTLLGTGVLLPPPMFNALFLTYHAQAHFLEEGLRLKQLLDWAMFLKRDANKIDWLYFYSVCEKYHMRRFASVATDIAVHYLGVQIDNSEIETNSPYTEKVVHSTLYDKDFVFSSGQSGWANRWHIIKNLFKYRWKYRDIYQRGILWQLWWDVVGFVFKSE